MMSLFMSFDNYFHSFKLLSFLFLLLVLFSCYKVAIIKSFFNLFIVSLESCFHPLKPSKFSKLLTLLVMVLFFLFFFVNFSSILPFNFSETSQISFVMTFSFMFLSTIFLFGVWNNLKSFLSHFIPEGCPIFISSFLFLIEFTGFIIRPITLTVRLSANILAGHLMMILLSKMVFFIPLFGSFYIVLNGVEFLVALIQSFIFCQLTMFYFSELS